MQSTLDAMLMDVYPDNPKRDLYKKIAIDKCMVYFHEKLKIKITKEEMEEQYASALFLLISNALDFEKTKGMKSIKQGNKAITYNPYENKQFTITDEIKDLFPLPRVVFKG